MPDGVLVWLACHHNPAHRGTAPQPCALSGELDQTPQTTTTTATLLPQEGELRAREEVAGTTAITTTATVGNTSVSTGGTTLASISAPGKPPRPNCQRFSLHTNLQEHHAWSRHGVYSNGPPGITARATRRPAVRVESASSSLSTWCARWWRLVLLTDTRRLLDAAPTQLALASQVCPPRRYISSHAT
ncbi:hypothetical protein E2C01_081551 [Portunus trituberculatus]|uniref:Uncharacterized protein n=1 Tax=Portunus trituberculatus TaxID=210409 RepID=A0A5B7IW65_PORTR|nr:hypothetical protein [Portunus trituberculatus]